MSKEIPFLRYIAHKLNVNAKETASFLQIDPRTLYNYANYSIEQIPQVVKDKYINFFKNYEPFDTIEVSIESIKDNIAEYKESTLKMIRSDFIKIANDHKKQRLLQREGLTNLPNDELSLMRELLHKLGIPIQNYNLTKGYLYSLFEVIFANLEKGNDYQFIEYISQYHK